MFGTRIGPTVASKQSKPKAYYKITLSTSLQQAKVNLYPTEDIALVTFWKNPMHYAATRETFPNAFYII